MANGQLPKYYQEPVFCKDSLLQAEVPAGNSYGTKGDPKPYNMHSDNVITALLLCSFILAVISFSNAKGFLTRQARNFFYPPREGTTEVTETSNEVRFQLVLVVLSSLFIALPYYFYTLKIYGTTFVLESSYQLITIYMALLLGYFLLKFLLYTLVNTVFVDSKRNRQWTKSFLFITALEGALFFPVLLLNTYFDLSFENAAFYVISILIVVKLLTIFKLYSIFFHQNIVRLQIILYLCALEMIPLLALWATLDITANKLTINY